MGTLPRDIVTKPFKGVNWLVQSRITITRTFQRTFGELGMARFISYSGRTITERDLIDLMWEALIKAYVYFIGLPFILNYSGQWIFTSQDLKDFFSQWPMAKTYFEQRQADKWKRIVNGDWSKWRDYVLSTTGYSKSLYDHFNPRESLLNVERYKAGRLLELGVSEDATPRQVIDTITPVLKDSVNPDRFFYWQEQSVPLVSAFIGLDLMVLFANIYCLTIYRKGVTAYKLRTDIPAWLKWQSAWASTQDGYKAKQYFDSAGKLKFTIPSLEQLGRVVTFNTYGLKIYLDISKMPCELIMTEPWTWQGCEPPDMELKHFETWYIHVPEWELLFSEDWSQGMPVFELAVAEDWSQGMPFDFELLMTEDWSQGIPFDLELLMTEDWSQGIPFDLTLKLTEAWPPTAMPWGYGYKLLTERWSS